MMIIIIIASLEFIRVIYSFIAVLKSHQPWPPRLLPDVQNFHWVNVYNVNMNYWHPRSGCICNISAKDECAKYGEICPSDAQCKKQTDGFYTCVCGPGYNISVEEWKRTCEGTNVEARFRYTQFVKMSLSSPRAWSQVHGPLST